MGAADHRPLAHAMSTPAGRRLARAALLGVAKYRGAEGGHPPAPGPARMPVDGPPSGAPRAGRCPPGGRLGLRRRWRLGRTRPGARARHLRRTGVLRRARLTVDGGQQRYDERRGGRRAVDPAGGRAPKTGKSEQTRALILETAMRLFQERGYDKTTMRAIAQEAGVSVGNAYYYFASKEP